MPRPISSTVHPGARVRGAGVGACSGTEVGVASGVAVAFPQIMWKTAKAVGIENGANLLLYGLFVATAVGFFVVYARMRRLGREITLLVRQVAINEAVNRTVED